MALKDRREKKAGDAQEKLPKEYRYEDKEQDHIDDYNKHNKEYYYDEEIDKSVFHDNRHDSGNR
ncbi:hypothetical protein [Salinicoccus halodurans]|uniref:Uncharacterized protein n=1 Tax=Salinicoccus halodurans TaxID=407035 RepID=A0A0F7HJ52_9STAP|nr:hypothetical protein [Salinicoccus halodurans]AKG73614.1 hypothetical protein AAT16_04940 [Salinicoccus halodurans]SFK53397.1 hypothetical protein SAMN05216235_0225 [Salinicoccus halodurans]